jgi:hypothetical protein
MLDLYGGTISILAGAQDGSKTRNNSTSKNMRFATPHFLLAEEPVATIFVNNSSTENDINIGGGDASMNSATRVNIFGADDYSTTTGTQIATFQGGAAKALMMGLGNSALSNWKPGTGGNGFKALQVGLYGALSYWDAGKGFSLSENRYFSDVGGDSWKAMRTTGNGSSYYSQSAGSHYFYVASTATADVTLSDVLALTIANDASATFGGNVSLSSASPTLAVGDATENSLPVFQLIGDADSDAGGAITSETFGIGLSPNADPTLSTWNFSDTQGAGYRFDNNIDVRGILIGNNGNSINLSGTDLYIQTTSEDHVIIRANSVVKGTFEDGANGLITLSGGTGGVRLDAAFGLSIAPQAQQAHIIDADGSLADITTKFNTLLADLEGYGLLASA